MSTEALTGVREAGVQLCQVGLAADDGGPRWQHVTCGLRFATLSRCLLDVGNQR